MRVDSAGRSHLVYDVEGGIVNGGADDPVEERAQDEVEKRIYHPHPAGDNKYDAPSETAATSHDGIHQSIEGNVSVHVHSTVFTCLLEPVSRRITEIEHHI